MLSVPFTEGLAAPLWGYMMLILGIWGVYWQE